MKNEYTKKIVKELSDILLDEMGREDLTLNEMAKKCGISKRKLCQIIYQEDIGLYVETLVVICKRIDISFCSLFSFECNKKDIR